MMHRFRPSLPGTLSFRADRLVACLSAALLAASASALSAQVKVMTNGDSITFGIGASDTNTRSYSAELGRLLGSGYHVQKDGTGGATMLKKGQPSFWNTQGIRITSEMNPSIVYIMLGTNDSKRGNWIHRDEYVADYLALIDLYRALPAKPQIYIGLPPPATESNGDVSGPIVANEVIPRILEVARQRDVRIVDAHSPFLDPFRGLLPDGIHPNDEGHRVIARAVRDAIVDGRAWTALPASWQRTDVGATGYVGGDAIDQAGVIQVFGGGATIGGTTDSFRFVHQGASGDVEVTARVLGQRNTDPLVGTRADSAAGVMIREGTAANARQVAVVSTPGDTVSFRWRDASGADTEIASVSGVGAPVWVRVRRSGNAFTGHYSKDGSSWTRIGGERNIAMAKGTQAGLAANSALGTTLTHARFGQVKITAETSSPGGDSGGDSGGDGGEDPAPASDARLSGGRRAWASNPAAGSYSLSRGVQRTGPFDVAPIPGPTVSARARSAGTGSISSLAAASASSVASKSVVAEVGTATRSVQTKRVGGQSYTGLESWRVENGLPFDGSGMGDDMKDGTGLGIPNLVRYALGLKALERDLSGLPKMSAGGGQVGFRFLRRVNRDDVDYVVEGSPDQSEGSWIPLAQSVRGTKTRAMDEGVTVTESGGVMKVVKVQTSAAARGTSDYYLRLKVRR